MYREIFKFILRFFKNIFPFFIFHSPIYVYTQNYHSELIDNKGNVKSIISSIYQSKEGFLWLGTDLGILRYDGTNYKTFKKNDNTSFNEIIDIVEDRKGNLWIHDLNGVYVLKNGVISRLEIFDSILNNQLFFDIKFDKDENIWLSTKGKVFKLSLLKNRVTKIDQFNTNGVQAYGLFVDKANCIWVGTESGVCKIKENKLFKVINIDKNNVNANKVWNIYSGPKDELYFNNNYINILESQEKYSTICKIGDSPYCGVFSCVKGNLSVFYNDGKAALYENFKFKRFLNPYSFILDDVSAFLIDNQQNIWVAYGTKLFKFTKFNLSWNPFQLAGNNKKNVNVSVLNKINDSMTLLCDMNYNIYIHNNRLNKLNNTPILTRSKLGILKKNAYPTDIELLSKDEFVISSIFNGLVKYNIKQNKSFAYPKYKKNDGYLNLTLIGNTIWSGATGFFAKINGNNIKFYVPPGFNDVSEVNSFVQYNNSDSIFIGTDIGIYLYYKNSVKRYFNHTIGNKKVRLYKRDKENIWVIVDGQGVYLLNISSNIVTPIKTKENCIEDFTGIYGFIDLENRLWVKFSNRNYECLLEEISHNHFLFKIPRISNSTLDFYNFGKRFVLPFNNYFLQVNDSGFYKININDPNFFTIASPLKIEGLKIREKLNDSLLQLGKCTLDYTDRNITFLFSRVDFETKGLINYEYYLDGSGSKSYDFNTENTSVTFSHLSPGNYTFYVRSTGNYYENGEMPFASYQFRILPPWYFTWWAYTLWVFLILSLFYLFFKLRINSLKHNADIERNILEAELKLLREQINPHYLSNSLMSLQSLVLDNDKEKAFEFIGQYGKVMRNILEKSNYSFIPFEQELQTLREYIKLEGLIRNVDINFEYHFYSDNPIANLSNVKVPTMIFQPFVENSILHGLVPSKEEFKQIKFKIRKVNKKLEVVIIDNGVGYVKKISERKSYGLENIQNRLKAYSKLLKINSNFNIETIKNNSGEVSGTQVIIYIPYLLEPEANKS